MFSMEIKLQIAEWQRKVMDGSIQQEELREAMRVVRGGRVAIGKATAEKRKRPMQSTESMLDELENLPNN